MIKKIIGYIIVIPIIGVAIFANIKFSIQDPGYLMGISIGFVVLLVVFLGFYLILNDAKTVRFPTYDNPPSMPMGPSPNITYEVVDDRQKISNFLVWLAREPDHNIGKDDIMEILQDYEFYQNCENSDYDLDEEGNKLSCCGEILDEDIMICPKCQEHN